MSEYKKMVRYPRREYPWFCVYACILFPYDLKRTITPQSLKTQSNSSTAFFKVPVTERERDIVNSYLDTRKNYVPLSRLPLTVQSLAWLRGCARYVFRNIPWPTLSHFLPISLPYPASCQVLRPASVLPPPVARAPLCDAGWQLERQVQRKQ